MTDVCFNIKTVFMLDKTKNKQTNKQTNIYIHYINIIYYILYIYYMFYILYIIYYYYIYIIYVSVFVFIYVYLCVCLPPGHRAWNWRETRRSENDLGVLGTSFERSGCGLCQGQVNISSSDSWSELLFTIKFDTSQL